jgi:uncharacterized protein
MQKNTFTQWFSVWFPAAVFLSCVSLGITGASATAGAAETGKAGGRPAADPRLDMVTALRATGPDPSLGDHAGVIGHLVGTWDVEYTDFSKDGKVTHRTGELIFGWVLDGRVLQDLWIVDPSGTHKDREVYTDLFYFDPKSETWSAAAIDPEHASVARLTGGAASDDRIVLDSPDLGAKEARWSFNDIHPDSFIFRDEASNDDGKTWRLRSEYHMKRRGAATLASD